jgi:hypothetical protein
MAVERKCDICNRTESQLIGNDADDHPLLVIKGGLLLCGDCWDKVDIVGDPLTGKELNDPIQSLVGKSAGAVAMTLNLPYEHPYRDIIDDAGMIQNSIRSPWTFVEIWLDGSTVWIAPDGSRKAIVCRDGTIRFELM